MAGLAPLLALLLAPPAPDGALLARLADRAIEAIAARSGPRGVEVAALDDRIGGGAGTALRMLLEERLAARGMLAPPSGPRVRAFCVLSAGTRRTWLSGTLIDEPGGGEDAFSVAVDEPYVVRPPDPATRLPTVRVDGPLVDATTESGVLDLAWLDAGRVLLLQADAAVLLSVNGARLRVLGRLALPAPWPVRAPAGVLSCDDRSSCWVLTSRMTEALLVAAEGDRLQEVARADALPWPAAPAGLRFRPGTNVIDVAVPGLPPPPYLRVGGTAPPWAVSPEGWLGVAASGWTGIAAGSAAAEAWPGLVALSSAAVPGAADEVTLVDTTAVPPRREATLAVAGSVRALAAARGDARATRLVMVVEDHAGQTRLLVYRLSRVPSGRASR